MSNASFYIAYDGPALESNEMEVRELAPALLALADLVEEANTILNGDRATAKLNIKGSFKTGCLGIDLTITQDIIQTLFDLGLSKGAVSAATLITLLGFGYNAGKGLLGVLAWLKNRKITKIETRESIATIYVDDDHLDVEADILKIMKSERARKCLQEAIFTPLEREGIETFCTAGDDKQQTAFIVRKEEREYYKSPKSEPEVLGDKEYETQLQLISPTFQDSNKWRFSDGSSTFYADVKDETFLAMVDRHQVLFGKGDILTVRMHERQILDTGGILRTDRSITKVISHRNASVQLKLV